MAIPGRVLDENYTRVLIECTDLDLWMVMLLDKVQKREPISKEDCRELREKGLVEGRYPGIYISSAVWNSDLG